MLQHFCRLSCIYELWGGQVTISVHMQVWLQSDIFQLALWARRTLFVQSQNEHIYYEINVQNRSL